MNNIQEKTILSRFLEYRRTISLFKTLKFISYEQKNLINFMDEENQISPYFY